MSMMYFTIWHYTTVVIALILFALAIVLAFYTKRLLIQLSIIFIALIMISGGTFMAFKELEISTKKAELLNFHYNRILVSEQIAFSGVIRNSGDYPLAKVQLELIIKNTPAPGKGIFGGAPHAFNEAFKTEKQVQELVYHYTVATDLAPKTSKQFSLMVDYPPYFDNASYSTHLIAH